MDFASIATFLEFDELLRTLCFTAPDFFAAERCFRTALGFFVADDVFLAELEAFFTAARNVARLTDDLVGDFFIVRNGLAT